MRVLLIVALTVILAGCSPSPPQPYRMTRFDPAPFQSGDLVKLTNGPAGHWWTVERVEPGRVHVVREPVVNSFWSGPLTKPTQREVYPPEILVRRVEWWSDRPEPEVRK